MLASTVEFVHNIIAQIQIMVKM